MITAQKGGFSMTIREKAELREKQFFSPYASFSTGTKGREREEALCDIRTVYQRDRDRILHAKSFRRLKHKTQVFLRPQGDHYRTRLTHTLEKSGGKTDLWEIGIAPGAAVRAGLCGV